MPWVKGQSGNPRGRPKKGEAFTEILKREGSKRDIAYTDPKTGEKKNITRKQALARKIWQRLQGKYGSLRFRGIWQQLNIYTIELTALHDNRCL